jgi:uncharacterized protein (DUF2267 family)
MQRGEFLDRVRSATGVTDPELATALIEATLATLGERIGEDEGAQLAAQLPGGFKEQIRQGSPERFGVDEFCRRVRDRSGLGTRIGEEEIVALFGVLTAAVSRGELDDVRGRLPDEYGRFFPD